MMTKLTVMVPDAILRETKVRCAFHGLKMQDVVERALEMWIESQREPAALKAGAVPTSSMNASAGDELIIP